LLYKAFYIESLKVCGFTQQNTSFVIILVAANKINPAAPLVLLAFSQLGKRRKVSHRDR
jgi:hypothetical protein